MDREGCSNAATLTALAEGRLDGGKRERVQAHVDRCAGCSLALRRIGAAHAVVRSIADWTPPAAPAAGGARLGLLGNPLDQQRRFGQRAEPFRQLGGDGGDLHIKVGQ